MASATRLKTLFLIGRTAETITGAKLPSRLQVSQTFFYWHTDIHLVLTVQKSSKTIEIIQSFWEKAGISTRAEQHQIIKLEEFFHTWKRIMR